MTFEGDLDNRPQRKRPVHQPVLESGNRAVVVFLTVCTKNRSPRHATPEMHRVLIGAWAAADHCLVGRYVILPDHIHLFCSPASFPAKSLVPWVRFWKSAVSKSTAAGPDTLWEKDHWDTQLRREDSYAAKWEYVRQNPVRHGLVSQAEDWPFQGEMHSLVWHA